MATTAEKLKAAESRIAELESENASFQEQITDGHNDRIALSGTIAKLEEEIALLEQKVADGGGSSIQRDAIRMAFIQSGNIRLDHVRPDAQKLEASIDELLKVWGAK